MENKWERIVQELGPELAERDLLGTGLGRNFDVLSAHGLPRAIVPAELGGGGASFAASCEMVAGLATYSLPTALALCLHFQPVALAVWKWRSSKLAEPFLRRVASEGLVVSATGTKDWLFPTGTAKEVEGGFRVSATKELPGAQSASSTFIAAAALANTKGGDQVLQFSVSRSAEGIRLRSAREHHELRLENTFVPDRDVELRRRPGWHFVWIPTLTLSTPIFLSCSLGAVERAANIVRSLRRGSGNDTLQRIVGEMENQRTLARLALHDLIAIAAEYELELSVETANATLTRQTLASRAVLHALERALEACELTRELDDSPLTECFRLTKRLLSLLPKEDQQTGFTGRIALDLAPTR